MIFPPPTCDARLIERFLAGESSLDEEGTLVRHLDDCRACQFALENSAGPRSAWLDAKNFLSPDEPVAIETPIASAPSDGPVDDEESPLASSPLHFLGPTDDPAMLGRIGPYEIAGVVGRGGAGIVLKAFQRTLNRFVAIKVLAPHLAASAAARKRFAREAQAVAAVVHEHIVPIHAVDTHQGLPYLVMRYVPGRSLQQRLEAEGPLGLREILRIGMQTAAGLAAAHAQGLVHRDIKPANILLENGIERVLVTDFGLARTVDDASLTCSGVIAGTPQYMAPEQARGEAIDPRTDLFSLGSVLYALATGRPPFRAETTMGVLHRICHSNPRPMRQLNAEIPEWFARIVSRLHAKDPAKRFQTAGEVAEQLEKHLARLQMSGTGGGPQLSWRERWAGIREGDWRRWRTGLAAGAAIAVCILVGVGISLVQPWTPEESGAEGRLANPAPVEGQGEPLALPGWDQQLREVRAAADRLEQGLKSSAPSGGDPWTSEMEQLRARADELSRQLSRGE